MALVKFKHWLVMTNHCQLFACFTCSIGNGNMTYCICFHYACLWSSHLVRLECGSRCQHYSKVFLVFLCPAGILHLWQSPPSCPMSRRRSPEPMTRHSVWFVFYCWWLGEEQKSCTVEAHAGAVGAWTLTMAFSALQIRRYTTIM